MLLMVKQRILYYSILKYVIYLNLLQDSHFSTTVVYLFMVMGVDLILCTSTSNIYLRPSVCCLGTHETSQQLRGVLTFL